MRRCLLLLLPFIATHISFTLPWLLWKLLLPLPWHLCGRKENSFRIRSEKKIDIFKQENSLQDFPSTSRRILEFFPNDSVVLFKFCLGRGKEKNSFIFLRLGRGLSRDRRAKRKLKNSFSVEIKFDWLIIYDLSSFLFCCNNKNHNNKVNQKELKNEQIFKVESDADFYGISQRRRQERKLKRAAIPKTDWFLINVLPLLASIHQPAKACRFLISSLYRPNASRKWVKFFFKQTLALLDCVRTKSSSSHSFNHSTHLQARSFLA